MRSEGQMSNDKFLSMIGFAKRAGKIVYGYDNLACAKGNKVKLFAVSDSASDKTKRNVKWLADKIGAPAIMVDGMETKVGGNCKALGITEENMASEIIGYVESGATGYTLF